MNSKVILGFILAFAIGVICRLTSIPLPAPPVLIGALLVVSMTVGSMVADRFASHRVHTQKHNCGGPIGSTKENPND